MSTPKPYSLQKSCSDCNGLNLICYDYSASAVSIDTFSSLKENAIACALLRDEQVEVVSNFKEGHGALLAREKAFFFPFAFYLTIWS